METKEQSVANFKNGAVLPYPWSCIKPVVIFGWGVKRCTLGSSFCYFNNSTSGRQGYLLPSVRLANLIANRIMLLVELAVCLGQIPCIEQPNHPRGL